MRRARAGEGRGLSRTGNFINLPPFREAIDELLAVSDRSFSMVARGAAPPPDHDRTHDNYMLVLEGDDGDCAGTSAIRGGRPGLTDSEHGPLLGRA